MGHISHRNKIFAVWISELSLSVSLVDIIVVSSQQLLMETFVVNHHEKGVIFLPAQELTIEYLINIRGVKAVTKTHP